MTKVQTSFPAAIDSPSEKYLRMHPPISTTGDLKTKKKRGVGKLRSV
jgi:hypothetical protein